MTLSIISIIVDSYLFSCMTFGPRIIFVWCTYSALFFFQSQKHSKRLYNNSEPNEIVFITNIRSNIYFKYSFMVGSTRRPWISDRKQTTCVASRKIGINALTLTALTYFCINHGDQRIFSIWNHHKCLSLIAFSALFEYLYYESTAIIKIFALTARGSTLDARIWRLQTSNADV